MIRQDTGLEKILIFFTGLRKYRCLGCEESFRAPDRRTAPRADTASMEKQLGSAGVTSRSS